MKRGAARPRSIRWLAGIAAAILLLAIVWALFVPIADLVAHHDVGSVTGPLHETALDNARGRLLALAAGLFAAGALAFTARTFYLSQRTFGLNEQGQVTDRYTKAIEQLGSDKLDVRIGGIYALERVARDSARDHSTVMEVVAAFIREHSHERRPAESPDVTGVWRSSMRPDVQAAVTVVGRRDTKCDIRPIDLRGADLSEAILTGADLSKVNLWGADLSNSAGLELDLQGANITNANLTRAQLNNANLAHSHLSGKLIHASLMQADLSDAYLGPSVLVTRDGTRVSLTADLTDAKLRRAVLIRANLTRADLTRADLTDADLTGANLTRANLTDADLTRAKWPADAPVPEGWKLDTSSGQLVAADSDLGLGPGEDR